MVSRVISELELLSPTVGQRYGLCEQMDGEIVQYVGGGNAKKVNVDVDGTWSYFRLTGRIRKQRTEVFQGCDGWKHTIPLRFVLATRRDGEPCDLSGRILSAERNMLLAWRRIKTSLSALDVSIISSETEPDTTRALKSEMPAASSPLELLFQYTDLNVDILSSSECLVDDCTPMTPPSGEACGDVTVIISLEGVAQSPQVVDTCENNTINVTIG